MYGMHSDCEDEIIKTRVLSESLINFFFHFEESDLGNFLTYENPCQYKK
jgi:hypothetical protein